jgi:glutathione S-transferase
MQFQETAKMVEKALADTPGPYFMEEFGIADVVFTPYVERMSASLYYYKGYNLRKENPHLGAWFDAMETRETYRGTQSDFHTHVHDLPPQMGGCYSNGSAQAKENQSFVDQGPWDTLPETSYLESDSSRVEALARVIKHKDNIIKVNPMDDAVMDEALRVALTNLMEETNIAPPPNSDVGLRYLRDRINVPRDMSLFAARRLREALERTASLCGTGQPSPIPIRDRRDQDPLAFKHTIPQGA